VTSDGNGISVAVFFFDTGISVAVGPIEHEPGCCQKKKHERSIVQIGSEASRSFYGVLGTRHCIAMVNYGRQCITVSLIVMSCFFWQTLFYKTAS
jgi:hypothetical protein